MNELQLSDDLTTIETEIKSYQNIAGQSIFEIGRRLKHVKENDLIHGQWEEWLEKVNFNRTQAYKFIKIYEDRGTNVLSTKQNSIDALYYIATLPEGEQAIAFVENLTLDDLPQNYMRLTDSQIDTATRHGDYGILERLA